MKRLILLFTILPILSIAQQTYVPDDNFEGYLEANGMGNGIPYDDSVTTANIDTITHLSLNNNWNIGYGIIDLTGIEDFSSLNYLNCCCNQITSLDVSKLTNLNYLDCSNNLITCLNVQNGNNYNMEIYTYNPNLSCIEVDDPFWSTTNWDYIGWGQSYNFTLNCNYPSNCFSTTTIQENTNSINLYPNPTNNLITIDIEGNNKPFNVEVYDFTGRLLKTTNNTTISLKDYPKGIYLLNVAYGDRVEQVKVVRK